MASSARECSDEELQKARHDLRELLARSGEADEFFMAPVEAEKKDKAGKKKKKKTKTCILPQEQVEMFLSYKCRPIYDCKNIYKAAQEDEEKYGDLATLATVATVLTKHYHDIRRAAQEEMRRQVETKGYFAYEATDDEAESDDESATTDDEAENDDESTTTDDEAENDDESATMGPQAKGGIALESGNMLEESKLSL